MSFRGVWGFDPDEALRVQNAFRRSIATANDADEIIRDPRGEATIPRSRASQVHELQRLFRL
jgi:hypothetical protein